VPTEFTLHLRVPAWCRKAALKVNGTAVDLDDITSDGYASIRREWRQGDQLELDLDMSISRLFANPEVRQDIGRVALSRGPLIYCVEGLTTPVTLPRTAGDRRTEPLGGVVTLGCCQQGGAAKNCEWAHRTDRRPRTRRNHRRPVFPDNQNLADACLEACDAGHVAAGGCEATIVRIFDQSMHPALAYASGEPLPPPPPVLRSFHICAVRRHPPPRVMYSPGRLNDLSQAWMPMALGRRPDRDGLRNLPASYPPGGVSHNNTRESPSDRHPSTGWTWMIARIGLLSPSGG
jgi:hypothetical protein